jgi:putative glutamine amidotransferase
MRPVIGITPEVILVEAKEAFYIDRRYCTAIEDAGGVPLILAPSPDKAVVEAAAHRIDGLLLSGGDDVDPVYYGEEPTGPLTLSPNLRIDFELAVLREVMTRRRPVLGICLGTQVINIAMGGTLCQDIPTQIPHALNHRGVHDVQVIQDSRLSEIVAQESPIAVQSSHHQCLSRLGDRLRVCGTASDGIVEAVEISDVPFFIGVQWHPERGERAGHDRKLFEAFVRACVPSP